MIEKSSNKTINVNIPIGRAVPRFGGVLGKINYNNPLLI
jgi:hypothetical protein